MLSRVSSLYINAQLSKHASVKVPFFVTQKKAIAVHPKLYRTFCTAPKEEAAQESAPKYNPPKFVVKPRVRTLLIGREKEYKKKDRQWRRWVQEFFHSEYEKGVKTEARRRAIVQERKVRLREKKAQLKAQKAEERAKLEKAFRDEHEATEEINRRNYLAKEALKKATREEFIKAMAEDLHLWKTTPDELYYKRYYLHDKFVLQGNFWTWMSKNKPHLTNQTHAKPRNQGACLRPKITEVKL